MTKSSPHSLLWYSSPASEWKEGLPIGNGRLAGMVMGGVMNDRVALNHEWLWRARNRHRDLLPKERDLGRIRELFFAGKTLEAGKLANDMLGGTGGVSGKPNRVDPYQPAGDLLINTAHCEIADYRRELDLDRALVTVSYREHGTVLRREYLAHSELPVIAVRLSTESREPFRATLSLNRIDDPDCTIERTSSDDVFGFTGRFPEGVRFAVQAKVLVDGRADHDAELHAMLLDAREVLVITGIAVDHDGGDRCGRSDPLPACLAQIESAPRSWSKLVSGHVRAHRRLYRGVTLDIGEDRSGVPTDVRLARMRDGEPDDGILALYANLGRYLLIASSRPGGLPANLQGKWNEELHPPWESDLHHDINLQMNYWPAEVCGLGELTGPLFDHIERFVPHGREAAWQLYRCTGVWFPIQTDPWGRSTPESYGWDCWIGAAAWLAQHLWWHYEYTLDKRFLRTRAYPFIRDVAAFYQDYLVPHPQAEKATGDRLQATGSAASRWKAEPVAFNLKPVAKAAGLKPKAQSPKPKHWLVPVPSQSPENRFVGGTEPVSLCIGATMDIELITDVLSHAVEASGILNTDAGLRARWRRILDRLPPLQIGKHGQLQEWLEDYDEVEPGHRHISHLFALYPGDQLTPEGEPELTRAARASLERRLAQKGGHTGWSRAWTVCCLARLREGNLARHHLERLVLDFATNSLLDLHPPRIFQIDGNFGGTAGLCEMLLQSHRSIIRILPALPDAWANGKVAGLRARGGFGIDIAWAGGRVRSVTVQSYFGKPCRIAATGSLPGVEAAAVTCDGAAVKVKQIGDGVIGFKTQRGKRYSLKLPQKR